MDFWCNNICQACLSHNRKMYPLCELQPILEELQFIQFTNIGGICWECRRIIMKMHKFKYQVIKAQEILRQDSKLTYQGTLSNIHKTDFDFKITYEHDPLKNNLKKEYKSCSIKKEENSIENGEIVCEDDKIGEMGEEVMKLDSVGEVNNINKNVLKVVKKTYTKETKDTELKKMFSTIILSEEEVIRRREQKRNHPNFKKIPFKCESCVLGFTRKENYDLHYQKKHNESIGPFKCPVCAIRFRTSHSMSVHRRRHYSGLRCRLCGLELSRRSAVDHCLTHGDRHGDRSDSGGDRMVYCQICAFVARSPEDLSEHKRTQHMLSCNMCGEKFKGKHTLRTHKIRIHTSNRDFVCDICKRRFKTKSRMESHMVTHNDVLAQKLSFCTVCNVQYKNIYVYRNHLKNSVNHSERMYHCKDCDKRFASKVYWQKHCDFYHLKKSQHKCHICDKLLISDWRLKNHMQTRHGYIRTRNHACEVCEKKFFTLSTLRAHQLTHSSERSYMCEQCGDTFKQRAALHTHTRALHRHTQSIDTQTIDIDHRKNKCKTFRLTLFVMTTIN